MDVKTETSTLRKCSLKIEEIVDAINRIDGCTVYKLVKIDAFEKDCGAVNLDITLDLRENPLSSPQ